MLLVHVLDYCRAPITLKVNVLTAFFIKQTELKILIVTAIASVFSRFLWPHNFKMTLSWLPSAPAPYAKHESCEYPIS